MNKIIKWLKKIWRADKKESSFGKWKEFEEIQDELYQRIHKIRRDKFVLYQGFTFLGRGGDPAGSSARNKHMAIVAIELANKTIVLYNVLELFLMEELQKSYPLKFDDNVVPFSSDKK
jgi:hypothetical protein